MNLRSVRKRCETTLKSVTIPDPFDVNEFAQVISQRRGRPLHLLAKQTSLGPCGVWLAMPTADYVLYELNTSALHRDHIVLHELGHLLQKHEPNESMDEAVLRELFPGRTVEVVKRVLGRTSYSAVEEQEAEMIASIVTEWVHQRGRTEVAPRADGSLTDRLQSTLGVQRRASGGG